MTCLRYLPLLSFVPPTTTASLNFKSVSAIHSNFGALIPIIAIPRWFLGSVWLTPWFPGRISTSLLILCHFLPLINPFRCDHLAHISSLISNIYLPFTCITLLSFLSYHQPCYDPSATWSLITGTSSSSINSIAENMKIQFLIFHSPNIICSLFSKLLSHTWWDNEQQWGGSEDWW